MARIYARRVGHVCLGVAAVTAVYLLGLMTSVYYDTPSDGHPADRPPMGRPGSKVSMQMVSDVRKTIHLWMWPETKRVTKECARLRYDEASLPTASVVISFCDNENASSLLHTVHSIVDRSPPRLLREVILVDDNTRKDNMKEMLENYLKSVFTGTEVRLYRSGQRLGLIRARLHGIRLARAPVVVVMDSHVEVQRRWLQPLLHEISRDGKTLAASCLDWMERKGGTWQYRHGGAFWKTYFDWTFMFGFQKVSERSLKKRKSYLEPIRSPVTVGTVFAIRKEFFTEVGSFDEGMSLWGGENIDLPIRVWLFGGRVVNVPCSRAAHLEYANNRNYRDGWEHVIQRNYKRIAEVWLGDYKKYFYDSYPHMKDVDVGSLNNRLKIRDRAVHNFSWYLENVFPELGLPDRDSFALGRLENKEYHVCLDARFGTALELNNCAGAEPGQQFYWSRHEQLRTPVHVFTPTTQSASDDDRSNIRVERREYISVYNVTSLYRWIHWRDGVFVDEASGQCLHALDAITVTTRPCRPGSSRQQWVFEHYTRAYDDMSSGINSDVYSDVNNRMRQAKRRVFKRTAGL